jgi:uncharacterized protein involved in exopolysaccharide biosynthesis
VDEILEDVAMIVDDGADRRLLNRAGMLPRHWPRIIGGGGVCAAAALVVSLFLPKIYRATTYILVSESKIGTASRDSPWQQTALLPTFVPFVDNDALISQTLQKLRLDRPPYSLTVDRFRRRNYLDVQIPKSTRLLELSVEFPDAQVAAEIVNDIAGRAVAFNDRMNAADTVATQEFLRKQLSEASARLGEAMERRLKVQQEASIDDREKELSILLTEKDRLSSHLVQLQSELAQDESRSQSLQQALIGEPRILQLKKSVTADPFLQRATEKTDPDGPPLSMTEEFLNTTREEIQRSLVGARSNAAAGRAGIQEATEHLQKVNAEISQLAARLALLRSEIDKADRDYSMAGEAVKSATRLFQDASVTVSSKSQDLKHIAPALVPERPVRPTIVLNTILGFLLGAFVVGGITLMLESYRELCRPRPLTLEEMDRETVSAD